MKNLWIDTIEEIEQNDDDTWYKIPDNVEGVLVNPISGKLANNNKMKLLYYIKGTSPIE